MRIVKLKGGIGNQMFQYTFAKIFEKRTGESVVFDASIYAETNETPGIMQFSVDLHLADADVLRNTLIWPNKGEFGTLRYKVFTAAETLLNRKYFLQRDYRHLDVQKLTKYTYLDGYWQSWKYVAELASNLQVDFKPRNVLPEATKLMMARMKQGNSVFVGVRRGDYTATRRKRTLYGTFELAYYLKGMAYIAQRVENPVFYVFSDDMTWVKKNMDFSNYSVNYREGWEKSSDFEELLLMASCRHAITVNSTFQWWGAYLIQNDSKIIVAPQSWFADGTEIDIVPDTWVRI